MKTTFKKSVLAFLTCVLALAFALTGCSGGGKDPKANFVGSWELSGGTMEGEELTDEYMKMLEDWGVHCVLILDEDGTGALDLFLEVVDLKWEAKDATTVTITAEDESHDMKLKDGKLILEEDDGNLVFTKSDKDLSGTVKKDREAAEKEEEIDEAVEDEDVQSVEISPAVTVADDDLCTITITEKFKDDWGDIGFVVNITNKSDKDLTFYAPSGKTNVNGTMKEPWFSAHLMPGTNATEEFTFSMILRPRRFMPTALPIQAGRPPFLDAKRRAAYLWRWSTGGAPTTGAPYWGRYCLRSPHARQDA